LRSSRSFHTRAPLFSAGYRLFPKIPYAVEWVGTTAIELANLAKHPMVSDVVRAPDGSFSPAFVNATGLDWDAIPEINVMHEAFNLVMSVMSHYDFKTDLEVDDFTLMELLNTFYRRIEDDAAILKTFADPFFSAEEFYTRRTLITFDL